MPDVTPQQRRTVEQRDPLVPAPERLQLNPTENPDSTKLASMQRSQNSCTMLLGEQMGTAIRGDGLAGKG